MVLQLLNRTDVSKLHTYKFTFKVKLVKKKNQPKYVNNSILKIHIQYTT